MDQEDRRIQIDRKSWRWGIFLIASLLLLGWLFNTPPGIIGKADAIGYAVCHRIDSRSFHLGDRQLPLCVRCSGQYLGALFGILFLGSNGYRKAGMPPWSVITILVIFVVSYAIDGLNSYLHLSPMIEMFPFLPRIYAPSNVMRLLTGSGMGFSISVVMFITFNRTIWLNNDRRPVIRDLKQLSVGIFLLIILDLLVLTENPIVLYPLSIVSALSVVFLLSMVYSLVVTMIFHMENRFSSASQLVFPTTAGFILAIAQLAIFDAVRFLLTGTWDGFQL
jgi:uncharacterized membrane protein